MTTIHNIPEYRNLACTYLAELILSSTTLCTDENISKVSKYQQLQKDDIEGETKVDNIENRLIIFTYFANKIRNSEVISDYITKDKDIKNFPNIMIRYTYWLQKFKKTSATLQSISVTDQYFEHKSKSEYEKFIDENGEKIKELYKKIVTEQL